MHTVVEVVVAFFAAGGLLALAWLLYGKLLAPTVGERIFAVVTAKGAGEQLEHEVSGLLWLRGGGMGKFFIIIVDDGLDQDGLGIAAALLKRESGIFFCPAGRLETCIRNA